MSDPSLLKNELLQKLPGEFQALLEALKVLEDYISAFNFTDDSVKQVKLKAMAILNALLELREFPMTVVSVSEMAPQNPSQQSHLLRFQKLLLCSITELNAYIQKKGANGNILPLASEFKNITARLQPITVGVTPTSEQKSAVIEKCSSKILDPKDLAIIDHLLEAIRLKQYQHEASPSFINLPPLFHYDDQEVGCIGFSPLLIEEFYSLQRPFETYFKDCNPMTLYVPNEPIAISVDFSSSIKVINTYDFRVLVHDLKGERFYQFNDQFKRAPSNSEVIKAIKAALPEFNNVDLKIYANSDAANENFKKLEHSFDCSKLSFSVFYHNSQTKTINDYYSVQRMDDTFLINKILASQKFIDFLEFLGNKVQLDKWPRFDGAMGKTKTPFSYYADWDGFEVMFHVAPLIPSQDEKDRLLKTDHIAIVFCEGDDPFDSMVLNDFDYKSFIAVHSEKSNFSNIRVRVVSRLPSCAPHCEPDVAYRYEDSIRDWIFTKAINEHITAIKQSEFYETERRKYICLS